MRMLWLVGLLTLECACSSYGVRCNKHLRPINLPDRSASAAQSQRSVPAVAPSAPAKPLADDATQTPSGRP